MDHHVAGPYTALGVTGYPARSGLPRKHLWARFLRIMNARNQYVSFHNSSPKSRKVTSDLVTSDLIKAFARHSKLGRFR
jgi:hypothetical protein